MTPEADQVIADLKADMDAQVRRVKEETKALVDQATEFFIFAKTPTGHTQTAYATPATLALASVVAAQGVKT